MKKATLICLILTPFLLVSCAQKKVRPRPSSYLLSTKRGSLLLIKDLHKFLEANKYTIRNSDPDLGILTTKPKSFSIRSNGRKVRANLALQIRQEGGSVKVRISYKCKYEGNYVGCDKSDPGTRKKISLIEPKLLKGIKEVISRKDVLTKSQELDGLAEPPK